MLNGSHGQVQPNHQPPSIYLALPTQNGWVLRDSAKAALVQKSNRFNLVICSNGAQGSLLGMNFNGEWGTALELAKKGEVTHFAMLHADIVPEDEWLDVLLTEMETTGAHVLSAIVAIKDNTGDCSTAVGWPDDPWHVKRLNLEEVWGLPETFSIDDCGEPGQLLLVNSGCMLIDLRSGWAHELDENNCLKTYFTIHDRIYQKPDGTYEVGVRPEDWNFSRMAAAAGCRVLATRKVLTRHHGPIAFQNRAVVQRKKSEAPAGPAHCAVPAPGPQEGAPAPALAAKE